MKVFIDGRECELSADAAEIGRLPDRLAVKTANGMRTAVAIRAGDAVLVSFLGRQFKIERHRTRTTTPSATASGEMHAPMPGQIADVLVSEGSAVENGVKILVLEAMKTQQAFVAPFAGTVVRLPVSKGDQVQEGDLLALIQPRGD